MMDHYSLDGDELEWARQDAASANRDHLARTLGRVPTEEELDEQAEYERWCAFMENERMKRWLTVPVEEGSERDDPKTYLRNQLLPKDKP